MSVWLIIFVAIGYLGLLFGVAYFSERLQARGKSVLRNPYAYALSLAVYCTAWTFYGSVGRAATSGIEFLTIYLGPTLSAPLWYAILRKIITISRTQRITSLADFISARYGKSELLGGLVTIIAIVGIVPYIALQLKAVCFSFELLIAHDSPVYNWLTGPAFYQNTAFFVAIILAIFTIFFGTRHLEATERHEGLVAAVAFESLVKLVAFLAVGIFVVYSLFDGPVDLFSQAMERPDIQGIYGDEDPPVNPWAWGWLNLISMFAVILLPRQFHLGVVENTQVSHVKKAIWLFPLYLFLINLFVIPIAFGGLIEFADAPIPADTYVLGLPLRHGQSGLALLIFIGGLSASTSMVIVATIALSIMASNHLIVPILLRSSVVKEQWVHDLASRLIDIRRLIIIMILFLAYIYYDALGQDKPLVSIGLISFTAVAQFAPSVIGGLFWRRGNYFGALSGLLAGFVIWGFTLPFPALLGPEVTTHPVMVEGLFGVQWLRPYALFGLEGFDQISHAAFWSLLINTGLYVGVSLYTRPSALGHSQANLFVNIYRLDSNRLKFELWRGKALFADIQMLLKRFLGEERAGHMLQLYANRNQIDLSQQTETDPELVVYAERLLAGALGASSARLLIASVVQEETLSVNEVLEILDETRQVIVYNKEIEKKSRELERASYQLKQANERLRAVDKHKDDFLTTVTHELRTPVTAMRSLTQIVYDNPELSQDQRQEFLHTVIKESERISRLINQVLDLEKMESGHAEWHVRKLPFDVVVRAAVDGIRGICTEQQIMISESYGATLPMIHGDEDRLTQVVVNLLSNAVKFCDANHGAIHVAVQQVDKRIVLKVNDNGKGIEPEVIPFIFDKFTQFNDHRSGRKQGSGLGLSITWRIVHHHKGTIEVDSTPGKGATFTVSLPTEGPQLVLTKER